MSGRQTTDVRQRRVRCAVQCAVLVALCAGMAGVAGPAAAAPIVTFNASGAAPGDIQGTVDAFRAALGGANNGVGGSFPTGRREINWDAVPPGFSAPNALPANFFNANSPRGAVFSGPGAGFMVSGKAADGTPIEFDNLNAGYSAQFTTFSAPRLFTSTGTNVYDVTFFVPGTAIPALVNGFGSVFTDVDVAGTTAIQAFGRSGQSLLAAAVSPAGGGLSFLGFFSSQGEIARVRITLGNAVAGANDGGANDVVVADDFIYGEPQAVPEPGLLALVGTGLAGLVSRARRSRRG